MYSPKTNDQTLSDILSNIGPQYDKTAGYIPRDLSSAVSIEVGNLHEGLKVLLDNMDVDNLRDGDLERYVSQRKGITRKPSSKALGQLTIEGTGTVKSGDLFETQNGIQFKSVETKIITTAGLVNVEAVIGGNNGNVPINAITLIPVTIAGIVSVNNANITAGGYDAETDDELRNRYYEVLRIPATSGNKYHYIKWAKECIGVGGAKCLPLWNGANTVKVLIIDANKKVAAQPLIDLVQNYIDPKGVGNSTWGTGAGQAPIGAYCTIESAASKNLIISANIIKNANYSDQQVKDNITASINDYLGSIAFNQTYVSVAQIGNAIMKAIGVVDYNSLLVNGGSANVNVLETEVAQIQTITLNLA